jgi:hypothetical protein
LEIHLGVESHFICEDEIRSEKYKNGQGAKMFFLDHLKQGKSVAND